MPSRGMAIRSENVLFMKGVLTRVLGVVALTDIQNVELSQDFLDPHFGLCNLALFTPASSTSPTGLDTDCESPSTGDLGTH